MGLTAEDVPLPGGRYPEGIFIDTLVVDLTGVRLQEDRVVRGRGRFDATFSQAQLRMLAPPSVADRIVLTPDGLALDLGITSLDLGVSLVGQDIQLRLPDNPLLAQLVPSLVGQGLSVPLNPPPGVRVDSAAVEQGLLRLRGDLDPVQVAAGL